MVVVVLDRDKSRVVATVAARCGSWHAYVKIHARMRMRMYMVEFLRDLAKNESSVAWSNPL